MSNSESASDDEPAGADVRWSALTLDQLVEEYWETVAPVMRADDMDPESEHPPHRWVQSDFSGLIYTLREHHDRTVAEFLRDDVGITPHDGYEWDLDDDAVATALDRHVDALRSAGSPIPPWREHARDSLHTLGASSGGVTYRLLSRTTARWPSRRFGGLWATSPATRSDTS